MRLCYLVAMALLFSAMQGRTQSNTSGPNSGSAAASQAVSGSQGTWTNPGNSFSSNNAYALSASLQTSGRYSDRLVITGFGFAIPLTSVIDGIEVAVERSVTGGAVIRDREIMLVKNGVIQTGGNKAITSAWPTADAVQAYGGGTDLWSNTWTPAEVNNANFGVAISIERFVSAGPPRQGQVDHVTITVYWRNVVPVVLAGFNALATPDRKVKISWTTLTEINASHFIVERSADGEKFQALARLEAKGHSTTRTEYQITDAVPLQGVGYYRLKEIALSGKESIFETRAVKTAAEPAAIQFIYDAAGKKLIIQHQDKGGQLNLAFANSGGGIEYSRMLSLAGGGGRQEINISLLHRGVVTLLWQFNGQQGVFRFMNI